MLRFYNLVSVYTLNMWKLTRSLHLFVCNIIFYSTLFSFSNWLTEHILFITTFHIIIMSVQRALWSDTLKGAIWIFDYITCIKYTSAKNVLCRPYYTHIHGVHNIGVRNMHVQCFVHTSVRQSATNSAEMYRLETFEGQQMNADISDWLSCWKHNC